jgi:hypothetical protein
MSNLLTSVDPNVLDAVLGGAAVTSRCSTSNDQLLQTLNSLSTSIQNIGNTSNQSGMSTTTLLMLGLLMNQNRQVVFVRRPFW